MSIVHERDKACLKVFSLFVARRVGLPTRIRPSLAELPIVVPGGATLPHLARVSRDMIGPVSVLRAVAIYQRLPERVRHAPNTTTTDKQGHTLAPSPCQPNLPPGCFRVASPRLCLTASAATHPCWPCHSLAFPSLN